MEGEITMFIEIINKFNLQLFAEAGTLVNATGNYVNVEALEVTVISSSFMVSSPSGMLRITA